MSSCHAKVVWYFLRRPVLKIKNNIFFGYLAAKNIFLSTRKKGVFIFFISIISEKQVTCCVFSRSGLKLAEERKKNFFFSTFQNFSKNYINRHTVF